MNVGAWRKSKSYMLNTRRPHAWTALLLGTNFFLLSSSPVVTQTLEDRRVLIGTSGGVQVVKDSILNEVNFNLFQEIGKFSASYNITTDTAFDGSIGVRLYKRSGVGVNVSHFNKLMTATIDAEVPHPYFFSFPRTTSGIAGGVTRREVAVHTQIQYWKVLANKFLVRGFFGPTLFDVNHDLVSEIITTERGFDFGIVDIAGYRTIKSDKSALGFNIGFDASYFVHDQIGLAFVIRYSRGTSDYKIQEQDQPVIELGGTHLAGGLHFVF